MQRFAVELRELRRGAGGPGYRELARRAHYSPTTLAQAARGEQLPTLAVTLAYVRACGGDAAEWETRWHAAAAAVGLPGEPLPADERAPYVGFAAYGPADAGWFHGRDRLLGTLIDRLARHRFVAVVGASGTGKSSLLRAGLPGAMVITPTAHPLEECAVRLGAKLGLAPGVLAAEFARRPRNLGLAIRQLMADRAPDDDLLLVVDQFEEIFTLCGDDRERDGFVTALLDAAGDRDSRVRVVVGLRADFLPHCACHPRLAEAVREVRVPVGPLTAEELAAAITQPAARAGLMVEKSLVATVVSEAADQPGALPFVSRALLATWRRRRGSSLFLAGYRAAGGLHGAVVMAAEQVYAELGEEQRRTARGVLVRLVALGDAGDSRRRVPRAELGVDPRVARVLTRLAEARLVTLDEDTVEIAHDALIDGWPALRTWLAEDRTALRAHRRLTEAAAEWDRHGRDERFLYRSAAWPDPEPDLLNEVEQAFLDASVAVRDRERTARRRRLRFAAVGLTAVAAVVCLLAVLALIRSGVADDERDLAYSRRLAADARTELSIDPELAMLLAVEATEVRPTPEADAVLRQAVVDSRALATLRLGIGRAFGVAYSADGTRIAVTGDDGAVLVWTEPAPGGPWRDPVVLRGHAGEVWHPVFSQDGRHLATAGADATVRVWDLRGGGAPVVLSGHGAGVRNIAFSHDGRWLASAADDGVLVWDVAERRESRRFAEPGFDVAFSPDGRFLATNGPAGPRLHDLAVPGEPAVFEGTPSNQGQVVFSPDGQLLVSTSDDGSVWVNDLTRAREPTVLHGHDGQVLSLAFSPDGRTLASAGPDGTIRLLTTGKDVNPLVLRGHRGEVLDVAFNEDGSRAASVGIDGTLRVWRVAGVGVAWRGHTDPALTATFAPGGSRVVSGGRDRTVRIWRGAGGEPVELTGHRDEIVDLAVGPDGRKIASISADGVLRVWDLATGALEHELAGQARSSVAFTQDSRRVVAGCAGGSVCVWPASLTGPPTVLPGYEGRVGQVAVDAGRIAASGEDGAVRVWPVDGRTEPTVLSGHSGPALGVALSPDGRRVASGGHDGTVRIWPAGGGEARVLDGHQGVVWSVVFSGDGRWLVTCGKDGTVRVWPVAGEGAEVVFRGYQASVQSVALSSDGRELLTTHDDGSVRMQDCEVCGDTEEVLTLARTRATRELTADERKAFGVRS